jgi:hypothetical protein
MIHVANVNVRREIAEPGKLFEVGGHLLGAFFQTSF